MNVAGVSTHCVGVAPVPAASSRAKWLNARLWLCTCWPAATGCAAVPMIWS